MGPFLLVILQFCFPNPDPICSHIGAATAAFPVAARRLLATSLWLLYSCRHRHRQVGPNKSRHRPRPKCRLPPIRIRSASDSSASTAFVAAFVSCGAQPQPQLLLPLLPSLSVPVGFSQHLGHLRQHSFIMLLKHLRGTQLRLPLESRDNKGFKVFQLE